MSENSGGDGMRSVVAFEISLDAITTQDGVYAI